jgi:hypothetical protein
LPFTPCNAARVICSISLEAALTCNEKRRLEGSPEHSESLVLVQDLDGVHAGRDLLSATLSMWPRRSSDRYLLQQGTLGHSPKGCETCSRTRQRRRWRRG